MKKKIHQLFLCKRKGREARIYRGYLFKRPTNIKINQTQKTKKSFPI